VVVGGVVLVAHQVVVLGGEDAAAVDVHVYVQVVHVRLIVVIIVGVIAVTIVVIMVLVGTVQLGGSQALQLLLPHHGPLLGGELGSLPGFALSILPPDLLALLLGELRAYLVAVFPVAFLSPHA